MNNAQIGFYRSLLGQSIPPTPPFANQYSMIFDGVDECIIFADDVAFKSTVKNTISLWFKCTTIGSGTKRIFDTGGQRLGLLGSTNQLRYQVGSDDIRVSGLTLSDGNWHHAMGCFDGSTRIARVYYDGALVYTKNPTINSSYSPQLWNGVGSTYLGTADFFNGSIDEVAFWHDTDQSANISSIYNGGTPTDLSLLPTQPTNYLRMGDGATWSGVDWQIPDLGLMSGTRRTINMELADRQLDVP